MINAPLRWLFAWFTGGVFVAGVICCAHRAAVDSITAATGAPAGRVITTIVKEPDGDWLEIKLRRAQPYENFYTRLYSGKLDELPAPVPAPRRPPVLITQTNRQGYYQIFIDNAKRTQTLTVRVLRRRSKGNKRADIVAISISNRLGVAIVDGSVGSFKCYDDGVGLFQARYGFSFFETATNTFMVRAGVLSNALITTIHGSIRHIRSRGDIINTEVRPGTDRFFATGPVGNRDVRRIKAGGTITGCGFFMGPAGFGDNWDTPTGHLTGIQAGSKKAPGVIEHTTIQSSNGVDTVDAIIGPDVYINGVPL
ncbi:hypothetical protein GX586_09835 [bacterium]|nr:hypothetical protein [bacterium]